MLNLVGFLLRYCSAPLSTLVSCLAHNNFLNFVMHANQHALYVFFVFVFFFFIICPRKPYVQLNWEDRYNAYMCIYSMYVCVYIYVYIYKWLK